MTDAPPVLVLLTGPPGTGKSTLAEAAAAHLGAAVLGWDWAMAALTGFPGVQAALRDGSADDHRRVGWSILWNLATAQLRGGRSAVLDGVARDVHVAGTRAVADAAGARCVVATTTCSDPALHRSRIEGRNRAIPGWHELDWDHVSAVVLGWEPPDHADLALDAAAPLADNVARLVGALDAAPRAAPSPGPISRDGPAPPAARPSPH